MKAIKDAIGAFRSGEGLKGQLLRGGVGSVAVKIGSTLLNVLLAVVLARTLGAEGFGVYSFVFALITILAIPAQMGLPNLVVRETAKAQATGDWALMKGLWRWSSLIALFMSAALMAIGGGAAWIFAANLPEGGLAVFYWGLVLVPLVALGNLRGAALRGLRHVVQGQLPEFILRPAFLIMLVLAAHFGLSAHALTASAAMMLHAVASLVAFAIGAWLLLRARPTSLRAIGTDVIHARLWLASALPLGMVEGMHLINENIGIIALGAFVSAEDVGLFRVALQGGTLVTFGVTAVSAVIAPYVAQFYEAKDRRRLQNIAAVGACAVAAIALPMSITFIVWGREIIALLFGEEFSPASTALVILLFGRLVNAFVATAGIVLNMSGYERDVAGMLMIGCIVNATLTLLLVPLWGIEGAAIASSAGLATWSLLLWHRVRSRVGIECSIFAVRG